jgi:predicted nucleic acid-binding protein
MSFLIDTNILLRIIQDNHPMSFVASSAVEQLLANGETVHVVPQNLYETWVVCTRSLADNGLGKTIEETENEFAKIKSFLTFLPDNAAIYGEWEKLVSKYAVTGKPAHDARLVAAMITHGITHIVTFNDKDFRRYQGITAMTPTEVIKTFPPPAPTS